MTDTQSAIAATLALARQYVAGGLSIVPVLPDGTKKPSCSWKRWQTERPDERQLSLWFSGPMHLGIAIICGAVSGGLEVLDFDSPDAYAIWFRFVEDAAPGFLETCPQVLTPAGGRHVYTRPQSSDGNLKLARNRSGKATIETRGEGGYVLAPGSPAACHPTGKTYVHVAGPALHLAPTIRTV